MYIQVMTEEQANNMPYNPFDLQKYGIKKTSLLLKLENGNLIEIQKTILLK